MSTDLTKDTTARSRLSRFSGLLLEAKPALYALLRIVFALVLLTHGLPKALGTAHGSTSNPMAGSIALMQNVMGLPFAPQLAFMIMLLETGGAILLAIGFGTRVVALLFAAQMAG